MLPRQCRKLRWYALAGACYPLFSNTSAAITLPLQSKTVQASLPRMILRFWVLVQLSWPASANSPAVLNVVPGGDLMSAHWAGDATHVKTFYNTTRRRSVWGASALFDRPSACASTVTRHALPRAPMRWGKLGVNQDRKHATAFRACA